MKCDVFIEKCNQLQLACNSNKIILNRVTDLFSSIEYCKVKKIKAYLKGVQKKCGHF